MPNSVFKNTNQCSKACIEKHNFIMATIGLYLDVRFTSKNGVAPLKFAVRNKGQVAYFATGIGVPPSCWRNGKVYAGKDAALLIQPPKVLNQRISNLMAKCELAFEQEAGLKTSMPAKKLRDRIVIALRGEELSENPCTLEQLFHEIASDTDRSLSTRQLYGNAFNKLVSLIPQARTMHPANIDTKLVERFYSAMIKTGIKGNTVKTYLGKFSAVYNYAVKKKLCEAQAENPFTSKKLKTTYVAVHRNILIEDFRRIWNTRAQDLYHLRPSSQAKTLMALDVFKLMFCLCGINLKDLVRLTNNDIINGRIETYRVKTNTRISVKLEPEALQLIKKLRKGDKLIGRLSCTKAYFNLVNSINKMLSHISPELTTYYARHTWATLAFDLDIPDHVIAMGLSHSYQTRNTNMFYINNDYKKLDVANRKILDYVKGEIEL